MWIYWLTIWLSYWHCHWLHHVIFVSVCAGPGVHPQLLDWAEHGVGDPVCGHCDPGVQARHQAGVQPRHQGDHSSSEISECLDFDLTMQIGQTLDIIHFGDLSQEEELRAESELDCNVMIFSKRPSEWARVCPSRFVMMEAATGPNPRWHLHAYSMSYTNKHIDIEVVQSQGGYSGGSQSQQSQGGGYGGGSSSAPRGKTRTGSGAKLRTGGASSDAVNFGK